MATVIAGVVCLSLGVLDIKQLAVYDHRLCWVSAEDHT